MQRRLLTLSLLCLAASPARAGDDFARRLLGRAHQVIEQTIATIPSPPPKRVPPTPIAVKWKAKRLGAVDLGAPLLAMTSGDLDGDGRAEIVAVTESEVEILAPEGRRAIAVVARARLPADAPAVAPRAPVAAAAVVHTAHGVELDVRSSTSGRGARYRFAGGKLKELGDLAGGVYPLCADRAGALASGRDYFERATSDALPAAWPQKYWSAACRDGLVDHEGRPLRVDAVVDARGVADVTVDVRCDAGEKGCTPERTVSLDDVGVAVAVADIDRDGKPEVITAAAGAPGDPDLVTVHTVPAAGGKLGKPLFKRRFTGGVGGVIADDVDGDGDLEVIAAVRLAGAERVDLWLLN